MTRTPPPPMEFKDDENPVGLFFDTETNGFPEYKTRSDDPVQPHIVQIAGILANLKTEEVIDIYKALVKPDGWSIPQGAIDVHGITNEFAAEHGRPEHDVTQEFLTFWRRSQVRVAHNTTFDNRIVRIATKRHQPECVQVEWKEAPYFCTMVNGAKVIGGRWPKLENALRYFCNETMMNAHDAFADAEACMKIFFSMQRKLRNE